ncbi:spore germination protein KB [Paenibacillus amylolyticus]|uniref:Spore germination protein KB n=1 Tax=Paenibacillus amylolyticus TaxID=1451 RepID=A0AAP5LPE3_PAEAM|nr:endospore germination permease [Paenibacillus amylolyticus]MDR6726772.1 spore germination protein KB [Paenibacillus amylolyticus]
MNKETLTLKQFTALAFLAILGDMTLIYPSMLAASAKQDAWLASIVSQPLGLLIVYVLYKLHRTYPELNFVQICMKILGKWIGTIFTIAYLFYFAMIAFTCIREVGDFLTTKVYIATPIRAIIILMVAALTWALLKGISTIGATSEILLPIFVLFMLILLLGLLPQVELSRLKPLLNSSMLEFWKGVAIGAFSPFGDILALMMVIPYVRTKTHLKRDLLLSSLTAGTMLTFLVLLSLAVTGSFITQHNIYISYFLSKKINIGGSFLRIEAMMASAWLISTYFKSLMYMYSFVAGVAQLFQLKTHKMLILPSSMLFFSMAVLLAPNVLYYLVITGDTWLMWDITTGFLIPLLLLLVHRIRNGKSKQN